MTWRSILAVALVATACTGPASRGADIATPTTADAGVTTSSPPLPTTPTTVVDTIAPSSTTVTTTEPQPVAAPCPTSGGVPFDSSLTATPVELLRGDGFTVDAVVYPRPSYEGNPWSQWGQGIVTVSGTFYSAIGDHLGADGNSYLYEYDPATERLTLIADVGTVVSHVPGSWGYGKVHAQMVPGPCGIYAASYWGSRRGLVFDEHYQGDHLLHIDPVAGVVRDVSVAVSRHGVPSMASSPEHGLVYAEAADPMVQGGGVFVALAEDGTEVFRADETPVGYRAMAVHTDGRALFSVGEGRLAVYDPILNDVVDTVEGLPGSWLRAATVPAPDGTIYGVTRDPEVMFALSPQGDVRTLGPVRGYTTSLAMTPDGGTVFYVPYAHGGSWQDGTPLIAVDTATGTETVLATLNPASEEQLGLTLGGTYNLAMSPDGDTDRKSVV